MIVGGIRLLTIVSTVATASMAPEAPRQWPIIDLLEEIGDLVGVVAERLLDGAGLGDVAGAGGGAVGVDVVDVATASRPASSRP